MWFLLALLGCGGSDDPATGAPTSGTQGPLGSCDDYGLEDFTAVAASEWPDGLEEAIGQFENLTASYAIEDCRGGAGNVTLDFPETTDLEIVVSGVEPTLACGCTRDPEYGPDEALDPIARFEGLAVQLDVEGIDPGVDGREVVLDGMLFGPDSELAWRGCGTLKIDPVFESEFQEAQVIVRREPELGELSGTIYLYTVTTAFAEDDCKLKSWELVTP